MSGWTPWHAAVILASAFLALFCGGCDTKGSAVAATPAAVTAGTAASTQVTAHNLTIYGYNYTDTEIGSFEVNGQGGGNVLISSPTSGGGKSTCCLTLLTPIANPVTVKIKWTRDSETWCENQVVLASELPAKPEYFEVHFYQDGHVEVAVTASSSPPRLALERQSRASRNADPARNANNDARYARCKLGYD